MRQRRLRSLAIAAASAALILAPQAGSLVAQAATPTGIEGVPHFDHVVVLTEENENASITFAANSPAHYLNSLRSKGVFLPNYYGVGHVSLDNYVAMVSGQPPQPLTITDCLAVSLWTCVQPQGLINGGRNLADQMENNGLTWRSYQDGTSTPCFHGPYKLGDVMPDPYQGNSATGAKNYADRHNPFIYFPDVIGNQNRCIAHQRPYSDLSYDMTHTGLPSFSFVTPDTCNDGHDNPCVGRTVGGLVTADAWLAAELPPLLDYLAANNGLLIINFDEGGVPSSPIDVLTHPTDYLCLSCASLGAGGRTGAILISPRLRQGVTVTQGYDHYSLLRTIEDSFSMSTHLGLAARAKSMSAAFYGTTP